MKFTVLIVFLATLLAVPAPGSCFYQVALDQYANENNYFDTFPAGDVFFDGIPFHIADTNPAFVNVGNDIPGWTKDVQIPVSATGTKAVHLLINGGNMYLPMLGVQVGILRFIGQNSPALDVPLIGGVNIREWSPYYPNQVINTLSDPDAREIWNGTWSGWMTVPARVDLYTVHIPESLGALQAIEIYDTVDSTSVTVYGITIEPVPEPSSLLALCVGAAGLLAFRRRQLS